MTASYPNLVISLEKGLGLGELSASVYGVALTQFYRYYIKISKAMRRNNSDSVRIVKEALCDDSASEMKDAFDENHLVNVLQRARK